MLPRGCQVLPQLAAAFPGQHTCPQVHCISTEFTLRKHGGEKGVPFRVQIDTFRENESGEYTEHLHSASCQIKVFKVPLPPGLTWEAVPVCPGGCWCLWNLPPLGLAPTWCWEGQGSFPLWSHLGMPVAPSHL